MKSMGTDEQLFEQLSELRGSKTIILGIGNLLKGDDGAGPVVCERLAGRTCAEVIDAGTVPENYIQRIIKKAPENLVVIDATDFGASAGQISLFKPEQLSSLVISTHTLSPQLFIDMICQEIDVDVYFVGIQPAQTTLGQSISSEVEQAIQRFARMLVEIFPAE